MGVVIRSGIGNSRIPLSIPPRRGSFRYLGLMGISLILSQVVMNGTVWCCALATAQTVGRVPHDPGWKGTSGISENRSEPPRHPGEMVWNISMYLHASRLRLVQKQSLGTCDFESQLTPQLLPFFRESFTDCFPWWPPAIVYAQHHMSVAFQVVEGPGRKEEVPANTRVTGNVHKLVVTSKPRSPSTHSLAGLIDERERRPDSFHQ